MSKGLTKGAAKLDLAIVGDDGHPRAWLAVEEKDADGWHPMTSSDIIWNAGRHSVRARQVFSPPAPPPLDLSLHRTPTSVPGWLTLDRRAIGP